MGSVAATDLHPKDTPVVQHDKPGSSFLLPLAAIAGTLLLLGGALLALKRRARKTVQSSQSLAAIENSALSSSSPVPASLPVRDTNPVLTGYTPGETFHAAGTEQQAIILTTDAHRATQMPAAELPYTDVKSDPVLQALMQQAQMGIFALPDKEQAEVVSSTRPLGNS